jgi:hypothetical protein
MSGFGHTLAGLCDGVSSIYATAPSSYRANGNIDGRRALTVVLLRADQTYDGRTYANPDEMLKIAENLLAYQATFARFRRFRGQDRASHRLGQRQFAVAASQGRSRPPADVL